MLILLTNDDGINAEGLNTLVQGLTDCGELVVIAPETPRNAASRSFSLDRPVRMQEVAPHRYAVDGSPVDCMYLGLHLLLRDRQPDLVLSGINHGPNLAQDVTYSGTVGAAMEAADWGVPAAALSLAVRNGPMSFQRAAAFVRRVVVPLLASRTLPAGVFLNVNIPAADAPPGDEIPWKFTKLGRHHYRPTVLPVANPRGRTFYWLGGPLDRIEHLEHSDCLAIEQGYASLTPLGLDLTAQQTWLDLHNR